jgi:putative transposase
MRYSFNHVVTSLVPELLGKDALLNETVAEIERRALEGKEDLPQVRQKEGGEEEGSRQVPVLEGAQGLPPGVVYGLEWVTVRLPVLYKGGERVRTRVEEELLREEGLVLRSLLLSVLGGKSNAKL